jgi:hypothetical protein
VAYVLIDQKRIDVTGDGNPDWVRLIGHRTMADSPYFEHLYVQVPVKNERQPLSVRFAGGYNPKMTFCDFTGGPMQRRIADVLVSAESGGSGGTSNFYMATFENEIARELPVPEPLTIRGRYVGDRQVRITIAETGQTVDLRVARPNPQQDGDILPNAFSTLEPVDWNRDGTCELRGVQRVAGAFNADTIAYVISVWRYQRVLGQWRLLRALIVPQSFVQ